ncbi:MAG: 3-oxoacyl-ACP reductase FabG [Anaerolineae bacterium]|nr:3-oxoacyl-ACP reductase FabG [Anaerolineae bacterium]
MNNRVAIVTGAARGIGEATARILSEKGAAVAIVDLLEEESHKVAESINASGGRAQAFRCDVSKPREIEALTQAVIAAFGQIDILVNNAGICPRIPIQDMTEEWFDKIININLKSVFFLTRAAAENMKLRNWGRIVNISSTGGRIGGLYRATVYSASKGGMLAMTKSMAREYAPYNILINAVAPGGVDTPMLQMGGEEGLRKYVETIPLRRLAAPAEIARSIVQLCSEETTWVTGATLDVNGGVVMM